MSNLTPTPGWDDVPQLEITTPALGGPGGPMNLQAQALLNRTQALDPDTAASEPDTLDGTETWSFKKAGEWVRAKVSNVAAHVISVLPDESVNSVADLRALPKTIRHFATVNGPTTVSVNGSGTYYLDLADTTTPDDNFFTIVATDGGRWKRQRLIWQTTTSAADVQTQKIARTTSHTGGTAGVVNSALRIESTVGAGVTNFEWAFLSVLDNSTAAGENVAIYGQGNKRAVGPTWAMVAEAKDHTNTANPAGALVGLEVDVFANGTDSNNSRIGIDVVAGKGVGAGATAQIYAGMRVVPANLDSTEAYYKNGALFQGDQEAAINIATTGTNTTWGIHDTGNKPIGIELGATYSTAAIRMAAGNKLAFDAAGTVFMRESSGVLGVTGSWLSLNSSFGVPSTGNTATTASAGANGALPAQVAGYVIFKIDGVNFKFPYYGS